MKNQPVFQSRIIVVLSLLIFLSISLAIAQEKEVVKEKAEKELQKMSPEQIDAKIKEYGMTRQQADAKAKELGIDLNTYLQRQVSPAGPITPEQVKTMQTETKPDLPTAEQKPQETPPSQTQQPQQEAQKPQEVKGETAYIGPGGIKYFGYDIFATVPSAFEPFATGPADPDYLIGPDDVLRITVWGEAEFQNDFTVDREGRIIIPTVGPILVSGLTLEKAFQKLRAHMGKSYSGLASQPPTVWMDVTIARLRPKRIFIMGEVSKPGGYTVSSYSTVFNSLYSVGGPTVKGSLRDIRVIRGGKVITHVDLYNYLTGAEKTNDLRVQHNDIIFVPIRGKTVTLKGEVEKPAIYELLPNENMKKLLEYAGGAKSTAYLERVQIDRVVPFDERRRGDLEREILDVNFREILREKKDYKVADWDVISVFSVLDTRINYVTIQGAVQRPGTYQLEKVPTLQDLVMEADSLLPEAYLRRADVLRTRPDLTLEAIHVDLGKAIEGSARHNLQLEALDQVRIYSIHEISDNRFVSIRGNVRNPGKYLYADSLTLYDLIFKAGGLTDSLYRAKTYMPRADLIRLNPDGRTRRTIPFNLGSLLDSIPGVNRPLMPEDEVVIHEIDVAELQDKFIEVDGKVRNPGKIPLTTNMNLADAILFAGGYTEDAWTLQAEIARVVPKGMGEDSLVYIRFSHLPDFSDTSSVQHSLNDSERANNFKLQHRDIIFIRQNPEYKVQSLVAVAGEVKYPGQYALKVREERLSSLLQRAGGITKSAYLKGGRMTRGNEPVVVDFAEVVEDPRGNHDIVLHPGDNIFIPQTPNAVTVTGEVNHPGILGYIARDDLSDYIDRAGGITDSVDYILVTFPNGNVQKYGTGWFAGNPKIDDGTIIHVKKMPPPPPKGEKVDIAATIKDVFAITVSAITIIVLARQVK